MDTRAGKEGTQTTSKGEASSVTTKGIDTYTPVGTPL